jgi:hypothetical protein
MKKHVKFVSYKISHSHRFIWSITDSYMCTKSFSDERPDSPALFPLQPNEEYNSDRGSEVEGKTFTAFNMVPLIPIRQ